jgi:hypothetical protein
MEKRPTKDDLLRELEKALKLAESANDKKSADKARRTLAKVLGRAVEHPKQKPD